MHLYFFLIRVSFSDTHGPWPSPSRWTPCCSTADNESWRIAWSARNPKKNGRRPRVSCDGFCFQIVEAQIHPVQDIDQNENSIHIGSYLLLGPTDGCFSKHPASKVARHLCFSVTLLGRAAGTGGTWVELGTRPCEESGTRSVTGFLRLIFEQIFGLVLFGVLERKDAGSHGLPAGDDETATKTPGAGTDSR